MQRIMSEKPSGSAMFPEFARGSCENQGHVLINCTLSPSGQTSVEHASAFKLGPDKPVARCSDPENRIRASDEATQIIIVVDTKKFGMGKPSDTKDIAENICNGA